MAQDMSFLDDYLVRPDPQAARLGATVSGIDQTGATVETRVVTERALTLYLNAQEIVTMMTIGDHPDALALGYLLNQNMLKRGDVVDAVDYDEELEVVVVRTPERTNFEEKLKKKTLTSGCAQGTAFGDLMEAIDEIELPKAELRTSWLYALTKKINTTPSLYLEAGAIHGCVLCEADRPLVYMEDVGRHNAVDKVAGWMFRLHHRSSDLGNGHQDRPHGHPRAGLPLRLHRMGRRTGPQGRPHPDRPGSRQALRRARRRAEHRLRPGPRHGRGGGRPEPAQGGRSR